MFRQEFGKYMRAAQVNRNAVVQSVMPSTTTIKRHLRSVPQLLDVLVDLRRINAAYIRIRIQIHSGHD